jgi:hypothetical protein
MQLPVSIECRDQKISTAFNDAALNGDTLQDDAMQGGFTGRKHN